jgi:hypothetical protein
MKKGIVLVIALAVFFLSGVYVWRNMESEAANGVDTQVTLERTARPIPTTLVKPRLVAAAREFPGVVEAHQRVELAFSVGGGCSRS